MKFALALVLTAFVQPPAQLPAAADVSVGGVFIADPASARKVLGADVRWESHGEPVTHAHFLNEEETELLTLYAGEGGADGAVSGFLVQRAGRGNEAEVLPVTRFISGKGVAMGMSEADVIEILGKPTLIENTRYERTLRYELSGDEAAAFLKRYKARSYSGVYTFQKGRLAQFAFGIGHERPEREPPEPERRPRKKR